jgi:hypothetical protein
VVDSVRGSVSVLVYPDILEGTGGTVIFEQAGTVRKVELAPVAGATYLLSELEELADGPFSVRLEFLTQ